MESIGDKYDNREKNKANKSHSKHRFSFDEIENMFLYFSSSIMEKDSEEEILWDLAKNCIAQLGFEDCVIYLLDESDELLVQKAAYGPKNPRDYDIYNPIQISVGSGICGSVAQSGVAEIIPDTSRDARYIVDDQIRYSELTVPIKMDGKVIGVIDCEHETKDFFTEQHKRIIEAMASICSIKISKLRAEKAIILEQKKLQDAQKQMDDLRIAVFKSQMNPHFLFNAMNAVQYFITADDKKSTLTYMSVLGKLLRYRLGHFQEEKAFLDRELEAVMWYLTLQKMRFGSKFTFEMDTPQQSAMHQIQIPTMVLPLIVEAAVDAALRNQPTGYIRLGIAVQNKNVLLNLTHNLTIPTTIDSVEAYQPLWNEQIDLMNELQIHNISTEVKYNLIHEKMGEVIVTVKIPVLS